MTERTVSAISRDAIGIGGVAWAYLALRSGSVSGAPLSAPGAALDTFRALYMDGRSTIVDALGSLTVTRATAESTLPRTIPVSGPVTRTDLTALGAAIMVPALLDQLNRRSAVASSYQGAAPADIPGGAWGTDDELMQLFADMPGSEGSALTAWFQRLTAIWPRGSSNAYARQVWWFTGVALGAGPADVASALDRAYTSYVFANADPSTVSATASIQQQAAAVVPPAAIPTGGGITSPPAVELDPTVIRARASGRSIWEWLVIALGFSAVGGLSWYVWFYRRRNTKPWRRR